MICARIARALVFMFVVAGGSFVPTALSAQAPAEKPNPGVFSPQQAEHGRRIYGAFCATCHGAELEGAVGPALAGPAFTNKWSAPGRTAHDLYRVLSTTMPRPAAGSLAESSYVDVLAYIPSRNGFAPGATPTGKGPSQSDLTNAAKSTDWLYNTHDFSGTRHAPLRQITTANVSRLHAVCAFQIGTVETFVTGPLVWQGTMYLTTARLTIAIDAATCQERWRHTWEPRDGFSWSNNRGVAIKDGYLFRGTLDGYLMALDAATGRFLWARQVAHPAAGEQITMAPLLFEDLVIIGPAGSELNVQGWIGAFRVTDGSLVWKFHTIPRPGEPGADTWQNAPGLPVGGGGVWTAPTLDAASGDLFVAVTNPAPDLPMALRPGLNLYTNSVVVLDVRTGALRWYKQMVPRDPHDWDVTQVSPLITVKRGGRAHDVVVTVGKDGMLRPVDRRSHESLYETAVTTRLNVGEPVTRAGVRVCPGVLGGVEWNGPAYDPAGGCSSRRPWTGARSSSSPTACASRPGNCIWAARSSSTRPRRGGSPRWTPPPAR